MGSSPAATNRIAAVLIPTPLDLDRLVALAVRGLEFVFECSDRFEEGTRRPNVASRVSSCITTVSTTNAVGRTAARRAVSRSR